jgi:hypothetical protein
MEKSEIGMLVIIFAALVALAVAVISSYNRSRQRSAHLKEHFGPEYERAVAQYGSETRAQKELRAREKRVEKLHIRLLSTEQCAQFGDAWANVQQRFVDEPSAAVIQADGLVKEVMRARGYPTGDFDQRVADLSVEHANVLDHYRAARALALANEGGRAGTEDLRQAMVHYRALFNDLLQTQAAYGQLRPAHS